MIFAELQYEQPHSRVHSSLAQLLAKHFPNVRSRHQGDSWIWVVDSDQQVAVDTFTSMRHQGKRAAAFELAGRVISLLALEYQVQLFEPPDPEASDPL